MTPKEKLEKFQKDIKRGHAIVFCVRCGSTIIDQNSKTELHCYDCGNTLLWDADRFSVARDGAPADDAASAFEGFEEEKLRKNEHDWQAGMLKAMQAFTDVLGAVPIHVGPASGGRRESLYSEDLKHLCAAWTNCRSSVNALFEQLLSDDDSTVD
jgi:hypothetical protein